MSVQSKPNVLLITTDQQRGDCLGIDGHPVVMTPHLDFLAKQGTRFRRAYSECPACIPARRCLMTGTAPAAHGVMHMENVEWNPAHTLAGEFQKAGYQTQLIGKLHLHPYRKRFGFDHMLLADGRGSNVPGADDHGDWLRKVHGRVEPTDTHGIGGNGWVAAASTMPEEQTHTSWCVEHAVEFLQKRDPTCPFFLNVSFIEPHPCLVAPAFFYQRYMERDIPLPKVADWARLYDTPQKGLDPLGFSETSSHCALDDYSMKCAQAAYFGMINHIDNQLGRLFQPHVGLLDNTIILFTSDHGEMLGDHQRFRKSLPYEGAFRVPFFIHTPDAMGYDAGRISTVPVGLQDVMPTLLDLAGLPIPETCTGKSLVPIMSDGDSGGRDVLHGEYAGIQSATGDGPGVGWHALVSHHMKYIWFTDGKEQLFNLEDDPCEMVDLAENEDRYTTLEPWRRKLIYLLKERPEGFSDGTKLITGRRHEGLIPGYDPNRISSFL
jgi:arylsulfatase A-like enzyme